MIAAALLCACGTDASPPELVVRDAAMGAGVPTLLGADLSAVYWSISSGSGPKVVAGSSLSTLPGDGQQLGMASGPIAQVRDHVIYSNSGSILRVDVASPPAKVASVVAEALGESLDADPVLVWTEGPVVSWGNGDLMESATLLKIIRCEQVRITATNIYIGAEGISERRLLRIAFPESWIVWSDYMIAVRECGYQIAEHVRRCWEAVQK